MEAKLLTAERFVDTYTGCSYRYIHSNTEYFRPHYHDYYEIFIPFEGTAIHLVNGEKILLEADTAVFIRPSDTHDYVCRGSKPFYMLNIAFTKETADAVFDFLGDIAFYERIHSAKIPPTVKLSKNQLEHISSRMTHIKLIDTNAVMLKGALRSLILSIVSDGFLRAPALSAHTDAPIWLIELREKLRSDGNFTEGISSIERLTDKSREHVARSMKKYYGETLSEYINDLRLNYIANMLHYSDHEILDIIFESGFNNVSWCYKCFSKKYGMSMAKYRNEVCR